MTDFFKSALGGMFGNQSSNTPGMFGTTSSTSTQNNSQNNDFVGNNIIIGNYKLKITKMIAEGV